MARYLQIDVECDWCRGPLGAYQGGQSGVDKGMRKEGKVVSQLGDFCNKTCLSSFKKNGNLSAYEGAYVKE